MSVHRCLTIDDILFRLLVHCDQSALAALARTCTPLRDFSLDQLWYEQNGLRNLIKCLPQEKWKEGSVSEIPDHPVDCHEWERLEGYSSRIHELTVHWAPSTSSIISYLCNQSGSHTDIFPHLKSLVYDQQHEDDVDYALPSLRMFFGPLLQKLSISVKRLGATLAAELTYLPKFSPRISDLNVSIDDHVVYPRLLQVVEQLPELRILTLDGPFPSVFPHSASEARLVRALSSLPRLEGLALRLSYDHKSFIYSRTLSHKSPLNPLIEVEVKGHYDFETLVSCLMPCIQLQLGNLTLSSDVKCACGECISRVRISSTFSDGTKGNKIVPLDFLKQLTSVNKLKRLSITTLAHTLQLPTLSQFTHLEDVTIVSRTTITDAELGDLSASWPNLCRLAVRDSGSLTRKPQSSLTLAVLVSLVYCCPKLEAISLHLDASACPVLPSGTGPDASLSNTRIRELDLRATHSIGKPATISLFLIILFPSLVKVSSDRSYPPSHVNHTRVKGMALPRGTCWRDVEECLSVMRRAIDWGRLIEREAARAARDQIV